MSTLVVLSSTNPWSISHPQPAAGSLNILFNHQLSPLMWEQCGGVDHRRVVASWFVNHARVDTRYAYVCMSVYYMICIYLNVNASLHAGIDIRTFRNQYGNILCLETHPPFSLHVRAWVLGGSHQKAICFLHLAAFGAGGRGNAELAR